MAIASIEILKPYLPEVLSVIHSYRVFTYKVVHHKYHIDILIEDSAQAVAYELKDMLRKLTHQLQCPMRIKSQTYTLSAIYQLFHTGKHVLVLSHELNLHIPPVFMWCEQKIIHARKQLEDIINGQAT